MKRVCQMSRQSELVLRSLRRQFCGAACFHTALDFGFATGESWGYCFKCTFSKQVDVSVTSEFGFKDMFFVLQIQFTLLHDNLLDGDGQCLTTGGFASQNLLGLSKKPNLTLPDYIVNKNCCSYKIEYTYNWCKRDTKPCIWLLQYKKQVPLSEADMLILEVKYMRLMY